MSIVRLSLFSDDGEVRVLSKKRLDALVLSLDPLHIRLSRFLSILSVQVALRSKEGVNLVLVDVLPTKNHDGLLILVTEGLVTNVRRHLKVTVLNEAFIDALKHVDHRADLTIDEVGNTHLSDVLPLPLHLRTRGDLADTDVLLDSGVEVLKDLGRVCIGVVHVYNNIAWTTGLSRLFLSRAVKVGIN